MDSDRERDQWEQEQARREEIAREERENDLRERMRIAANLDAHSIVIRDQDGHEWGCPAYNPATFTTCTCGAVGQ